MIEKYKKVLTLLSLIYDVSKTMQAYNSIRLYDNSNRENYLNGYMDLVPTSMDLFSCRINYYVRTAGSTNLVYNSITIFIYEEENIKIAIDDIILDISIDVLDIENMDVVAFVLENNRLPKSILDITDIDYFIDLLQKCKDNTHGSN